MGRVGRRDGWDGGVFGSFVKDGKGGAFEKKKEVGDRI